MPVLPHAVHEKVLLQGLLVDVWLAPGVTKSAGVRNVGLRELTLTETGDIRLMLRAGNITSIPPLAALYQLFAHNRVVLLKLNLVVDAMRPVYEATLAPLISRGLLRIVAVVRRPADTSLTMTTSPTCTSPGAPRPTPVGN